MARKKSTQDKMAVELEGESYRNEAFPRVSTTETPDLEYLSSTSESDFPQISLSKQGRTMSKAKTKRTRKENQRNASSQQVSSTSLRPVHDVMNRIRHDPDFRASDYVVGYKDRHVGIMEKAVENWSFDGVEEEEFIPLHRVVYFRRVSDDRVVWDREKRIDEIFGSGTTRETRASDDD
ncbi:MAG: hypothetical protein Q9225_000972 [Loekoesia sp. 1 TL-2023]